jgi:Protein of unknown function (DUF3102)
MIAPDAVKELGSDYPLIDLKHGDATLADEINGLHNQLFAIRKTVLEKAIRIGDLLSVNKKAVPHGAWLRWTREKLVFGDRQAQKYISIYEGRDELRALANANSNSYLSVDGYYLLLKKTEHQAAREQPGAAPTDSKPSVVGPKQKPKSVEDEIPAGPEDDEKTIWRKGLLERAQKAIRLAAYDDWSSNTFDQEVIDATAQAAAAWQKLAAYLRERSLPF